MSSTIEEKVEQFAQELIELHGFRRNNGFSCVVPDTNKFPNNEGIFLWGFSQTRKRFETKIEKFHTFTRIRRMEKMINVPAKVYVKILPAIKDYLESLKALGFKPIGKGVKMFEGEEKVFNVQADASTFENNLENLKKFEEITLNNPIIKFVEKHGYFEAKNKDKLAWDIVFGSEKTSKKTTKKPVAKVTVKASADKSTSKVSTNSTSVEKKTATKANAIEKKTATKASTVAKKTATKASTVAKKTATKASTVEKKTEKPTAKVPLKDQLKKLATGKTASSQAEQRNIWLQQIDVMYKKIQSWLSEHSKSSHIVFNTTMNRLDDSLGSYDVETLEVNMVGGHQIAFKPIETDVLGAIGRVDIMHSGNNKTMLLLFSKGKNYQWEIWNSSNDRKELNKENIEKLLTKWIES